MQIEKLGPYRIGKQIGKGGMGAVYAATYDTPGKQHGMRVAVKALAPQLAAAEGFRERFEAEIESLKKLRHDGIVHLYGYGEQDGILFYSMELVEGSSLEEELCSGRRFDWRETVDIGIQICHALKHAHDHGVVHRDIKPANLMLTPEGQIKIADFGIARLFGGTQLTTAGGVLGTADYMSPEQAEGSLVTEKCDQYSFGGVMYALLAGRPPFRAKSMPQMLQLQRFAEPEPVSRYAPDTPDQLDQLITQLLAKDPETRFPNVLVLGRHMEAMKKALSRPVEMEQEASDTLAGAPPTRATIEVPSDLTGEVTRAMDDPSAFPHNAETNEAMLELYDAPTLAESENKDTSHAGPTATENPTPPPPPKQRFTTVDEDARQQREQAHGSRVWLAAQLAGLATALGVLVWSGWLLMQPPTVEELYKTITTTIDQQGTDNLRIVSSALKDFLARFPNDARADEIARYQHQLEFQRFERQARRRSRSGGAEEASPLERLYLSAMAVAEDDPARGLKRLRSLLALYGPTDPSTDTKEENNHLWLVLARKQIEKLALRVQQQSTSQLPVLQERLALAAKIQASHPDRAHGMYQAIVALYADQPWAKEIVEEASRRLAQEQ